MVCSEANTTTVNLYLRYFPLFTSTFHCRIPVSALIPYNMKFIKGGLTERATSEERIPRVGRGSTVLKY
jgi:hypothetical protein